MRHILLIVCLLLRANMYVAQLTFKRPPPGGETVTLSETNEMNSVLYSLIADDKAGNPPKFSILTSECESQTTTKDSFTIDSLDQLVALEGLDAENCTQFRFTFSVTAGGTTVTSDPLHLKVTDINDNAPRFSKEMYTGEVWKSDKQNVTVNEIDPIAVTDPDVLKLPVTLSISGAQTIFAINSSGFVYVIDPSGLATLQSPTVLTIQASDGGLTSTATLNITVHDDPCNPTPCQNGATCRPERSNYTCGCVSGYVGDDCQLVDYCFQNYCLNNGTCINGDSSWTCNCTDNFIGSLTNCSQELQPNSVTVNINESATSIVIPVDGNETRIYTPGGYSANIQLLNTSIPLNVNFNDSYLQVQDEIDRDQMNNTLIVFFFNITIEQAVIYSNLTLNVSDINDNPPIFERNATDINVCSAVRNGTLLFKVTATDADVTVQNNYVIYDLIDNSGSGHFTIDSQGNVSTTGSLNDVTEPINLTIIATDGLHNTSTYSTISVYKFQCMNKTLTINETNEPIPIMNGSWPFPAETCQANLSFLNETSTYSFNGTHLILQNGIDREKEEHVDVMFNITIDDASIQCPLTLVIEDVNDNSPIFTPEVYKGCALTGITNGTSLLIVTANDLDATREFNSITYSLEGPAGFIVNSTSGEIRSLTSFNQTENINFTVKASDGEHDGSAYISITVYVGNCNSSTEYESCQIVGQDGCKCVPVSSSSENCTQITPQPTTTVNVPSSTSTTSQPTTTVNVPSSTSTTSQPTTTVTVSSSTSTTSQPTTTVTVPSSTSTTSQPTTTVTVPSSTSTTSQPTTTVTVPTSTSTTSQPTTTVTVSSSTSTTFQPTTTVTVPTSTSPTPQPTTTVTVPTSTSTTFQPITTVNVPSSTSTTSQPTTTVTVPSSTSTTSQPTTTVNVPSSTSTTAQPTTTVNVPSSTSTTPQPTTTVTVPSSTSTTSQLTTTVTVPTSTSTTSQPTTTVTLPSSTSTTSQPTTTVKVSSRTSTTPQPTTTVTVPSSTSTTSQPTTTVTVPTSTSTTPQPTTTVNVPSSTSTTPQPTTTVTVPSSTSTTSQPTTTVTVPTSTSTTSQPTTTVTVPSSTSTSSQPTSTVNVPSSTSTTPQHTTTVTVPTSTSTTSHPTTTVTVPTSTSTTSHPTTTVTVPSSTSTTSQPTTTVNVPSSTSTTPQHTTTVTVPTSTSTTSQPTTTVTVPTSTSTTPQPTTTVTVPTSTSTTPQPTTTVTVPSSTLTTSQPTTTVTVPSSTLTTSQHSTTVTVPSSTSTTSQPTTTVNVPSSTLTTPQSTTTETVLTRESTSSQTTTTVNVPSSTTTTSQPTTTVNVPSSTSATTQPKTTVTMASSTSATPKPTTTVTMPTSTSTTPQPTTTVNVPYSTSTTPEPTTTVTVSSSIPTSTAAATTETVSSSTLLATGKPSPKQFDNGNTSIITGLSVAGACSVIILGVVVALFVHFKSLVLQQQYEHRPKDKFDTEDITHSGYSPHPNSWSWSKNYFHTAQWQNGV